MADAGRTTVVYIGSHDRSGTTLLDRLLGELPGCVSAGEVRRVWDRGRGENQLCGCGTPFRECDFWRTALRESYGDLTEERAARIRALASEMGRMRRFPSLLTGPRRRSSPQLRAYGELLQGLYRGIAQASGCDVVIDSSKDPVYGATLLTVPGLDVRLVHLVRDARAVAFSQRRERDKPEIHWKVERRKRKPVAETAVAWDLSVLMWRVLARRAGATSIRYEDLAGGPADALAELAASLGGGALEGLDSLREGVHLGVAHTVSGGAVRFHRGRLDVVPDSEWRRAMPSRERGIVTALTWPGLLRFGYPLRAGARGGTDA